jgi:virginiamycin B lyase
VPTAAAIPTTITSGPDGNLWFMLIQVGFIGEINPDTHASTEFPFVGAGGEGVITSGPDGNMWFVGQFDDFIAQVVLSKTAPDLALEGSAPSSVTLRSNVA